MTRKLVTRALVCAAAVLLVGSGGTKSLQAAPKGDRHDDHRHRLHVTKECSKYNFAAGGFCTIASSNVPQIAVGSIVTYDQAAGIPAGMLDSNVVLDAGGGNRAVGRCTLDLTSGLGLCTFSDGTGDLAGFHARIKVSPPTSATDDWHWEGIYGFDDDF